MNMEFRHGLEVAKDIVNGLWAETIHSMNGMYETAQELSAKMFSYDYGTSERNEAERKWKEHNEKWSNRISKADMCEEIYEAINREIAKSREAV